MRKSTFGLVLAMFMATPIAAQEAQIPAPSLFSIRSGEKMLIRLVGQVSPNCEDLFISLDSIDVLEGPPEVMLTFEAQPVRMTVAGKMCPETNGGHLMIAIGDIYDKREANLIVRLRYKSKGVATNSWTLRWHLLMYPAGPRELPAKPKIGSG